MTSNSNKRKKTELDDEPTTSLSASLTADDILQVKACEPLVVLGNDRGFSIFPMELTLEVLSHYPSISTSTFTPYESRRQRSDERGSKRQRVGPSPHELFTASYLERSLTLRALSSTCRAYRRIFLPLLWDTVDICFDSRASLSAEKGEVAPKEPFHKVVGETLLRISNGLQKEQHLAAMVRTVNVVFTRHRMEEAITAFARCLRLMPKLHTIHVLDANPQMPKAIKKAFQDVNLPSVRTVIIPGTCHELLKSCPGAETVWCNQGTGQKLVTVIRMFCKEVREVRGFRCEEDPNAMKTLVEAIPDLQTLEINAPISEKAIQLLPTLSRLSKVDLRVRNDGGEIGYRAAQRTIKGLASTLHRPSGSPELVVLIPESMVELVSTLKNQFPRACFRILRGGIHSSPNSTPVEDSGSASI